MARKKKAAPRAAKRRQGRPAYEPTEKDKQQVMVMAGFLGMDEKSVAKVIGISNNTLRKHFEHELDHSGTLANAKVAGRLFEAATRSKDPNITAMIFWLKAKAGWRDGNFELGGSGGAGVRAVTFHISEADSRL